MKGNEKKDSYKTLKHPAKQAPSIIIIIDYRLYNHWLPYPPIQEEKWIIYPKKLMDSLTHLGCLMFWSCTFQMPQLWSKILL